MSDICRTVSGLIERRIPALAGKVILEEIPSEDGLEVYETDSYDGKPVLRGSSAVALACALNEYVKYDLKGSFSWCGDRTGNISVLPAGSRRKTIPQKLRAYMNYCTLSYSAAWWEWNRWEEEIDRMALAGINMPLTVVGTEYVWYETLLRIGYTDSQARDFICGPAYIAWFLMANLQSFGGPVSLKYLENRRTLGRKIIDRELEFGMKPIQHGFAGFVPRDLSEHFPDAKIGFKPEWCSFEGAAQLDPTDPLFEDISGKYYQILKENFGSHGYYAVDPFHESTPPCDTDEYLNRAGKAISDSITRFDPHGTAVMQSWSLRKPVTDGMSTDILVLDFDGRYATSEYWWGKPFLLGNLHNFGGRINLHGDIRMLAENRFSRLSSECPNICGTGMFMEGIGRNPLYYDLAFEAGITSGPVDLNEWLSGYALRRYGAESRAAAQAVYLLSATVYKEGTNGVEYSSMICARPALHVKKSGPNYGFCFPYPPAALEHALALLMTDSELLKDSDGYRYDVADLTRQVLSNRLQDISSRIEAAFLSGNGPELKELTGLFLQILDDVDRILNTRKEFSFADWVDSARRRASDSDEERLFVRNASTLVTIWGPEDPSIFDYGWREWGGLIKGFYRQRWKIFFDELVSTFDRGEKWDEVSEMVYEREAFEGNPFYRKMAEFERNFARDPGAVEGFNGEDTVEVAKELMEKYGIR